MSRADTWMPLDIGAYLADTSELSTTEHGAYLLLLMHHWKKGDLPDDDAKLARIAKLRIDHWKKVAPSLRGFFGQGERAGTLRQKRLHRERVKAHELSLKRAAVARDRWENEPRTPPGAGSSDSPSNPLKVNETADANALSLDGVCKLHIQLPSPTESREEAQLPLLSEGAKPERSPRKVRNGEPEGFAEWYAIYPRHEKRPAAARAFTKALPKVGSVERLIELTNAFRFSPNPQYIPHPASWLNDERWTDTPLPDPKTGPGRVVNFPGPRPADAKPPLPGSTAWREQRDAERLARARAKASAHLSDHPNIIDHQAEPVEAHG